MQSMSVSVWVSKGNLRLVLLEFSENQSMCAPGTEKGAKFHSCIVGGYQLRRDRGMGVGVKGEAQSIRSIESWIVRGWFNGFRLNIVREVSSLLMDSMNLSPGTEWLSQRYCIIARERRSRSESDEWSYGSKVLTI